MCAAAVEAAPCADACAAAARDDTAPHQARSARRCPAGGLLLPLGPEPGRGQGRAARAAGARCRRRRARSARARLVWLWSRLRGIALFDRDGSLPGGLLAGLLFAAEFGCIFIGLQYTTASRMVVFIYLAPFVVALGMPFIARTERLVGAADRRPRGRLRRRRLGVRRRLPRSRGRSAAMARRRARRAGGRAVGCDDAGDPRHPAGQRLGREDAVLPARGLGRRARALPPGRPTSTGRQVRRCSPGRRSASRPSSSASRATWSGSG